MILSIERFALYLAWPAAPLIDTAHGPLAVFLFIIASFGVLLWKTQARAHRLRIAAALLGAFAAGAVVLHLETNDMHFSAQGYAPPFHNAVVVSCVAMAIAVASIALRPRRAHALLAGFLALWFAAVVFIPWERAMAFPRREFVADLARLQPGMTRSEAAEIMKRYGTDKEFEFYESVQNTAVASTSGSGASEAERVRIAWAPAVQSPFFRNTAVASFDADSRINALWYAGKTLWTNKVPGPKSTSPNTAKRDAP